MAVSGHSWITDFIGDIIGGPVAIVAGQTLLMADVEIAAAPTAPNVASVVRVVAEAEMWGDLVGTNNARVRVIGKLWTTATGIIRCTPTSIANVW